MTDDRAGVPGGPGPGVVASPGVVGSRVLRVEDQRLLTVGGTYVDDLRIPELTGAARITFVRSPVAHALVTGIDASAALAEPGVVAVLTAADMPAGGQDVAAGEGEADPEAQSKPMDEPLLAVDRVRYVGEPVAIVLTDGGYQGEDAAELVSVDYEPLTVVASIGDALAADTLLFPSAGSNVTASGGDEAAPHDAGGDSGELFGGCDVVVGATIVNQRVAPVPLEVRGAAAVWDGERLTVWASTQNSQISRSQLVGKLSLDPAQVRVIVPDVGGGFGAKIGIDRETIAVARAAMRAGRPVRWSETRSENLVGMTHGRAQRQEFRIGGTRDGKILAYRLDVVQDGGAYPRGTYLPSLTRLMASGAYLFPKAECGYRFVVTSTTPIDAYRGAGRPEATAAVERAVDLFAAEIGMDPAEVRRRNLLPAFAEPHTTLTGGVYDNGAYPEALDRALWASGY
ncbi:MAG: xanthine dehydrogenase family protein molybdopterin-binding subunit, partial [Streptosporangiaceae bacterium]